MKVTAGNLASAINALPKDRYYDYPATDSQFLITEVNLPEGPIKFKRWKPSKGETPKGASETSISTLMLWRLANAIEEGVPVNVDSVFGASYNSRSVLEAMLAYTPQFYLCMPGRWAYDGHSWDVKEGIKHLLYCPDSPHPNGVLGRKDVSNMAVTEIPGSTIVYDSLMPAPDYDLGELGESFARQHLIMQTALYEIGKALGFSTHIADNDQSALYDGKRLVEHEGMIRSLSDVPFVNAFSGAPKAGRLIDCIWFTDRSMPAVIEVEHSTGVNSGLERMLNFYEHIPSISTSYIIVADDGDREDVMKKIRKPAFEPLNASFMSYSTVNRLYDFCNKCSAKPVKGILERFIYNFIEFPAE